MRLRTRIVVAVLAVAIIHLLFYAVPRWRETWPQFRPQAYEAAMTALREEFGANSSLVSIPKVPVSVPYCGQATICDATNRLVILYLGMPGEGSYLLHAHNEFDLDAAALSREQAVFIWAAINYLCSAESSSTLRSSYAFREYISGFTDRTWGGRNVRYLAPPPPSYPTPRIAPSPAEATDTRMRDTREVAVMRLVERLRLSGEVSVVEATELMPALRAVVASTLPAQDDIDASVTRFVLPRYRERETSEDLPTLRRIEAGPRHVPWILLHLPFVSTRFQERERKLGIWAAPSLKLDIWAAELVAGKSEEETFQTLLDASGAIGSAKYTYNQSYKAGWLLEQRWSVRWHDILADNYATLHDGIDGFCVFLRDDRLTRMIADDPKARTQVYANLALFRMTGDREHLLKAMDLTVASQSNNSFAVSWFACDIIDACAKGARSDDAAAFARRMLRGATHEGLNMVDISGSPVTVFQSPVVDSMGAHAGDEFARVLLDIVMQPDTVLNPALSSADRASLRFQAAQALCHRKEPIVSETLAAYLESGKATADGMAGDVIIALINAGRPEALPVLEKMLAEIDAKAKSGVPLSDYDKTIARLLQDAIKFIKVRASGTPDPANK